MKKYCIILFIVFILMIIPMMSLAIDPSSVSIKAPPEAAMNGIKGIGGNIIGSLKAVGTIVSLAVLAYIGIKFMIAAPSEKAQLKTALMPYIVGAVIILAASTLANIIYVIISPSAP